MPRILVVDDDAAVRTEIKIVLERDGQDVEVASSGRAGIAAAKAQKFDVVIWDIFMPGMDGIETITEFHQIDPDVPIIAKHESRHRDDRYVRVDLMEFGDGFDAVHAVHEDIADHDVEFLRLGCRDAGAATACDFDVLPVTLKHDLDLSAHRRIVVNDE